MAFKFGDKSLSRLITVDERLQVVAHRALELTRIDFGIPEYGGKRTAEEQEYLYRKGSSKLDGYSKFSRHQSGSALDVYAYVGGKASWEPDHLTHIAAAMLQAASEEGIRLSWGGFWRGFVDMPHFELI